MAEKTPVRVVFNASNVATGLAEFQSGDAVGVSFGGTGLNAIGSAGQIIKVNAAGNALEFGAEGDVSITNLVAPTNSDLTFTTSGTGNIVLDAITIRGTTINSADSSTININDNVEIDGNLVVTGTVDFNDQNISNVGSLSIDSISGDADTNTSITFSGSDVITIATGGSGRLTVGDGALSPVTDSQIDLGTSSLYYKDAYIDSITTTGNVSIGGNLDVTGTLDLSDSNFTNVGALQLDSIAGDGDTNTSITFSGSDVITVATGGSTALTVNADQSVSLSGALTVTGVTTLTGGVSTNSVTGDVIPGKLAGTNFTDSLLVGHATTGTLDDSKQNVGVGFNSLNSVTSGDANSCVGFDSGTALTTGSYNAFIGAGSGRANATGTANTALGRFAQYHVVNGSYNTSVGSGALTGESGTTSVGNTALGSNALQIVSTGEHNIGIGRNSGDNITTGDGNVIIGGINADSATGDKQLIIADGTDGSVAWIKGDSSGNLTTTGDVTLANTKKVIFGDAGEHIVGDGTDLTLSSSNNMTLDTANQLILDADTQILLSDGGSNYGAFSFDGTNTKIVSQISDKGMVLRGNDGGSFINALSIDFAGAGAATFNDAVILGTNKEIQFVDTNESIKSDGSKMIIKSGGTTFNLPTSDGTSGQALITDGAGTLSFDTVSTTTSSDTRAIVKNNKTVNTSARTVDYFQAAAFDMAWYFVALNDLTNDNTSGSVFTVCHNNSDAFIGGPRGGAAGSSNAMPTTSADIASSQVRVKITGPSADSKISFYKIPISRASTSDATVGVTVTTSNTDVDSASESIDTFAHASFRAAKYVILIDDNAKTETGVTEALVVHDGTNAFVTQYGTLQTGNNDMITLSAAISGSNVVLSAAGLTPNLSLKIHKTLLADSMTAESNANQKIIAATTVSSTATAFDSFDLDDATAAVYYVVGKNATEGAYSVQEVYLAGDVGEAGVSSGPFVSTKGTTQLEFTADFLDTTDNTVQMSVSSTSGGSTTVNAYRINCLAGE